MNSYLPILLLSGLSISAALAQAPPAKPNPEQRFQHMDKNKDSKISSEEFFSMPRLSKVPQERQGTMFQKLDQDQDGYLNRSELSSQTSKMRENWKNRLIKLDTDKNGGLSFEEFKQGERVSKLPEEQQRKLFQFMDKNADGQISKQDRQK